MVPAAHGDRQFFTRAGDFHLDSGSSAIDNGATLSEVTTDSDGTLRPQGARYDLGAYEYKSGGGGASSPGSR